MQELLKYQELDSKLRKRNAELQNNENRAKANQMQQYMRDSQSKIIVLDESASKTLQMINKLKQEQEKVVEKIEKILKASNNTEDELLQNEEEATKLAEVLSKIERELTNIQNKLVSINKDFEQLMKNAKTAKSNLIFYKQEYEKAKQQIEPQIETLLKELQAQKKKVKPDMMAKYQSKSEGKIFPIFVPFTNSRCGGCHMEVPVGKIKELETNHYIECENCGRYIYKI
ncbi:MAG: hypothetical protein IJT25_00735 [Clostridia bacterium]|nr:hypothetical protein [Clostridia bacterium]